MLPGLVAEVALEGGVIGTVLALTMPQVSEPVTIAMAMIMDRRQGLPDRDVR